MNYLIYIFFGIIPSIIWLLFYLKEDANPEPNRMVIKIFSYGMLITLPIISFWLLAELLGISEKIFDFVYSSIYLKILYIFIGIAFIEEFLKYLVVKEKVLKNSEFDEPIDAAIYMIIAALGFAALENLLYLSPNIMPGETFSIKDTAFLSIIRFIGATFLHALCSGTLGYFLALSIHNTKKRKIFLIIGLLTATLLHGLYNFSIMELKGTIAWAIPVIILFSLAIFLTFAFQKLKKIKSVCRVE